MKQITDNIYLDCDENNLILTERKIAEKGKNAGKEYFAPIGFYGNYDQLSNKIIEIGFKKWINGEWEEMVEFIKTAEKNFKKIINERIN